MKLCKIDGCNSKHYALDYCVKHYNRFQRHGDPNINKRPIERHGMSHTSEYASWSGMKDRCLSPSHNKYHRYGGRGITICARWLHSFKNFYKDMGPKPFPDAQIDREDNDGNYEFGNCKWVKLVQNIRNSTHIKLSMEKAREIRTLSVNGYTVKKLTEIYNVSKTTIENVIHCKTWRE